MGSYTEIIQEIEKLQKQAARLRKGERSAAIRQARELVKVFNLTGKELGLSGGASKGGHSSIKSVLVKKSTRKSAQGSRRPSKTPVQPKFRDPETGKTWSGRGLKPKWLSEKLSIGHSLDAFRLPPTDK